MITHKMPNATQWVLPFTITFIPLPTTQMGSVRPRSPPTARRRWLSWYGTRPVELGAPIKKSSWLWLMWETRSERVRHQLHSDVGRKLRDLMARW